MTNLSKQGVDRMPKKKDIWERKGKNISFKKEMYAFLESMYSS